MVIFVLLTTVVLATLAQTGEKSPSPKVAVIGGGIGGTSVAYFLSERLPGADVTVFEMGRVGGRLDTVDIAGRRCKSSKYSLLCGYLMQSGLQMSSIDC